MPVKITFDTAATVARITGATEKALKTLKPQIVADCNEFCPKDDGTLRRSAETNSSVFDNGDVKTLNIVYSTPYARALYYGVLMVDPKTHKAGFLTKDGEWRSRKNIRKIPSPEGRKYTYHTPRTGKLWCETARNVYSDDWRLILQNALREGLK